MAKQGWWDWRQVGEAREEDQSGMSVSERTMALEELASRCVVIDNLPSNVTHQTVRTALGQFGSVMRVKRVMSSQDMKFTGTVFVAMESKEQRDEVVTVLRDYLFMLGAMPRPSRAIAATPLLLLDHPWRRNPNKTKPRLVSRTDPGAALLLEREERDRQKAEDDEYLVRAMEEDEKKLSSRQEIQWSESLEKLDMIGKARRMGTIATLSSLHGLR